MPGVRRRVRDLHGAATMSEWPIDRACDDEPDDEDEGLLRDDD